MVEPSNAKDVDDLCLCGRGRLHEGFTELKIRIENTLLVIKNVPARICDFCDEAYISPEIPKRIDRMMENYRAGRLEVKPIAAGEIDLKQSA
jgi:YgiT-type zinc finger domain-containing protein